MARICGRGMMNLSECQTKLLLFYYYFGQRLPLGTLYNVYISILTKNNRTNSNII